jgi:spore germination protein KC
MCWKTKTFKGLGLFIVLISMVFLNGCWDNKDIDKRLIPLTMGISQEDSGEYQVSLQIPTTPKEAVKSRIVTEKGKTVADALGRIQMNAEDAVDFSRISLILFNEKLIKHKGKMAKIIIFLMKSREIPSTALVATTDNDVQQVLSNINDKLGVSSTSIYDFFNTGPGWAPEISSSNIWQVYKSLYSYTQDIAIPIVRPGRDTTLSYEGSAVMSKGVMYGIINPDETLIYNLFKYQNASGKIETFDLTSVRITDSSIHQKAFLKNDKPQLSIVLDLGVRVLEKEVEVSDVQVVKSLEKTIIKQFYTVLEQSRKKNIDLFGFGQFFRNQYTYSQLKDWRTNYYHELKVNFNVQANLKNI